MGRRKRALETSQFLDVGGERKTWILGFGEVPILGRRERATKLVLVQMGHLLDVGDERKIQVVGFQDGPILGRRGRAKQLGFWLSRRANSWKSGANQKNRF